MEAKQASSKEETVMSSMIILALILATAVISMTASVGTSFAQNSPRDCTTYYYGKGPC
jgi:hypothetical protein